MIARHSNTDAASPAQQPVAADWLGSLSALIRESQSQEFKTVDALLTAVACDDVNGGSMLKRILHWSSVLEREFYLSNTDWWQQCRVSRHVIDRVKAAIFPACGVVYAVRFSKRANANVTHYSLNRWAFLHRLSQVVELPVLLLAERCVGIQQNVLPQTSRTLTIDSSLKTATDIVNVSDVPKKKILSFQSALPQSTPEQSTVVELLKKAGVWGNRAVAYATLPEDIVRRCIADAQSWADNNQRMDKRIGYLMGALKNQKQAHAAKSETTDYQPMFQYVPTTQSGSTSPHVAATDEAWQGSWQAAPVPAAEVVEATHPRLDAAIHDRNEDFNTPRQIWLAAFKQLELRLDSGTWQTFVSRAQLVDYADGVWTIQTHNGLARDMLEHRMQRTIWRLLTDFSGQEVELKFTIAE